MKAVVARYIQKAKRFLKRKLDLSFLNSAGVLLIAGLVFISLSYKGTGNKLKANSGPVPETHAYHNLAYIKPFTSLVGFNLKFWRDTRSKAKEEKTLTLTALTLETLLRK